MNTTIQKVRQGGGVMKSTITCPHCNEVLQYKSCITCKHFHPHYVMCGGEYCRIDEGHCNTPGSKHRKNTDYCAFWDGAAL